jgi:hypothetical protein
MLPMQQPEWAKSTRENGRFVMPLFITQGRFTREYMPDAKAASMLAFVATGGGGIEGSVTE